MEIRRAIDLGDGTREKISEIFIDGFYGDLKMFCKDRELLTKACVHMFALRYFYTAIIDGEIAGVIACLDKDSYCVRPDRKMLLKHMGFFKGMFANYGFKYFSHDPKYPAEVKMGEKTASVEFVVTNTKHKKKGVATAILNHLHALPEYNDYVLEVKDTNTSAVELYKKMGYQEVYRKKFRWAKYADFEYFVYMKYSKPAN
ncbi:MAG: GNAT family N-acetyltransferase [Treponema sp.]|nr:GNAT family N-acetyltransferase [Treponema sp.]